MAESRTESAKYVSAAALYVGCALTAQGTNYKEAIVATTTSVVPLGFAAQTGVQNDNIGYLTPGQTVKAVASAAIAINAIVAPTTAGKMVTVTKGGTQTETNYAWGWALSAAAADGDVFEMQFQPFEMESA